MMELLKNMLGLGPKVDYAELIKNGAAVVDVRSRGEFAGGHAKGAVNIPLDQLNANLRRFKSKDQVIITCCASGMRSSSAKQILKQAGFVNVHNAGPWQNVA
ncbi:MAG: rhodanese-like domain-containing protein [Cyclobacteriaceae bacterium]|jgi:phage shock protein E|nr:rhodanese-like domain-containing protein [Flammeovirgaceae bacterium]